MKAVELVNDEILEHRLREHLERRELPDAFLYTGNGAANWLSLEASPGFPVAAALTSLMEEQADFLARHAAHCQTVVSIGAGDARKEFLLLRALLRHAQPVCQVVDVSQPMVERALRTLAGLEVETTGLVAFCEDLDELAPYWDRPTLLCLLGNNFSNYEPAGLLNLLARHLGATDRLLLDASLLPENEREIRPWVHQVEDIYNSPENVRFNLAPLVARGLDPESCRFELRLIQVASPWGTLWRTQKRIHLLKPACVRCGTTAVAFAPSEVIEMGFTYKYRLRQLRDCLESHGFGLVASRSDATGGNAILLAGRGAMEIAS